MKNRNLFIITAVVTIILYAIGKLDLMSSDTYNYTFGIPCHFFGGFAVMIILFTYLYPHETINKYYSLYFKRNILFYLFMVIILWELFEWIYGVDYKNNLNHFFIGYKIYGEKQVVNTNWSMIYDTIKDIIMSFSGGMVYMRYFYRSDE